MSVCKPTEERRETDRRKVDRGWHLRREISIGHIVTTMTVAGGAILWLMSVETRIEVLAERHVGLVHRVDRSEARISTEFREIKQLLRDISTKLDRKADR